MSDEDLATRAPESDAVKDSPFRGDSVAQEGPSMGEHCATDRPTPSGEVPSGEVRQINGVDAYITKPADYPHSPSKLLLFLTNGTGIHSKNNQLQADKFAAEGFVVVMPDQFAGDPAPGNTPTAEPESSPSLLERIKLNVAGTAKSFLIDMWLARHTPQKVLPILYAVIEGVRDEFADAVAAGHGIVAVGYCFGGRYALALGADDAGAHYLDEAGTQLEAAAAAEDVEALPAAPPRQPLVRAAAVAHGTLVAPRDLSSLAVPTLLVCVEKDPLFADDVRLQGVEAMEKRALEHEVKVFPEVPHGFAVLGEYDDPKVGEAQRAAWAAMLGWVQAH